MSANHLSGARLRPRAPDVPALALLGSFDLTLDFGEAGGLTVEVENAAGH